MISNDKLTRFPYSFAKQHGVLLQINNDNYTVVHRPGIKSNILQELRRYLGHDFQLTELNYDDFQRQLAKNYEANSNTATQLIEDLEDSDLTHLLQTMPKVEDLLESDDDAPIIRLLNALFTEAIKQTASDIHVETFEDRVSIRYRIDGVLREVLEPPRILAPMLISRIKVMAKLDIAEKRLPQDGRIGLQIAGRTVDLRVSTMPTNHGERVVMRILDKQNVRLDLTDLGMNSEALQYMEALINQPHGILLVTGPTGSGKTTTLYAALTKLNTPAYNILTVEDPIEYDLPGVGQTQVNIKADMTFSRGLRAMLRQDPDIVMVGEIRDLETAETAVQASLTGHLVLSTLHTNSAVGAITRLGDMGVEPFLIASSLIGVVAQRLVRLLCPHCKQAYLPDPSECKLLGIEQPKQIYRAKGCEQCNHTGYCGRTGIYEVVPIKDEMRQLIHDHASEKSLEEFARKYYGSIRQDGMRRVLEGDTAMEEVLRVTSVEI